MASGQGAVDVGDAADCVGGRPRMARQNGVRGASGGHGALGGTHGHSSTVKHATVDSTMHVLLQNRRNAIMAHHLARSCFGRQRQASPTIFMHRLWSKFGCSCLILLTMSRTKKLKAAMRRSCHCPQSMRQS